MSKIIKIQIIHSLALNSAKNETYQKGVVDKAVKPELIQAAYHEQAGNEAYHETMLQRSLLTQIEMLKTYFHKYLTGGGNIAEDATIDSTEENGITEIILNVNDRFNNGYVKTLARLSQKYVEDRMIHLWWLPVSKEFASIYVQAAAEDLEGIQSCFYKVAPTPPRYKYPTGIEIRYPIIPERNQVPGYITPNNEALIDPEILFSNPWLIGRGQNSNISYTLTGENDEKPIDDIVIRVDNGCCMPCLNTKGNWYLKGMNTGYSIVTLVSRHNDKVFAKFAVRIVDNR